MLTKALVAPVQQSGAATQWRSPARLAPYAVTLCYAVLVAVGILHHEPWADEAQAWQLSRCLSVPDLLIHHLRYEGHPGLWYVVLWCLNRLHVSYAGMHWFTGLMATCGVGLLIFRAPFPRSVRYVLPFTFYLAFQYAVVARGYALAPLLLFAVAVVWRRSSLLLLAVLLGFLANLELFFIPVSLGFAVLVGFEIHRAQRAARLVWASAIVLAVLCVLSLVTVFPLPKDILYGGLSRDGLLFTVGVDLIKTVVYVSCSFGRPWYVGIGLMTGCVLGLWRMSKAVYLLPLLLLALACGYTFNFWHFGLMMLVAIASAWIAWPMGLPTTHWRRRVAAYALLGFILVQISWELHAFWYDYKRPYSPDIAAARFLAPYVAAGTPMALTYVKTWSPEPKPDPRLPDNIGAFHSVGLYPYFSGPLFLNEPLPYWVWSTRLHRDSALYAAMRMHPPIVVAVYSDHTHEPFDPKRDMQRPRVQYLLHDGYRLTHVFCGAKPEDLSEREQICDLIFQP